MFEKKLEELEGHQSSQPESFLGYLDRTCQKKKKNTPEHISIHRWKDLDRSLRKVEVMVFRLGACARNRTDFGLARCQSGWSDYFIFDDGRFGDDRFGDKELNLYTPELGFDKLFTFQLLPNLSESALIDLAFASGLMGVALGVDSPYDMPVAMSGAFNPTFTFRPFPEASDWIHDGGQVQFDGAVVGKRGGKRILFVIEAKADGSRSLAKHKLFYPAIGLIEKVPIDIPVVPVYLRVSKNRNGRIFKIAECNEIRRRKAPHCVSEISVSKRQSWIIGGF